MEYCPKCGFRIENIDLEHCSNCGHKYDHLEVLFYQTGKLKTTSQRVRKTDSYTLSNIYFTSDSLNNSSYVNMNHVASGIIEVSPTEICFKSKDKNIIIKSEDVLNTFVIHPGRIKSFFAAIMIYLVILLNYIRSNLEPFLTATFALIVIPVAIVVVAHYSKWVGVEIKRNTDSSIIYYFKSKSLFLSSQKLRHILLR